MNIGGRPPQPKGQKVRNNALVAHYKSQNQSCEVCNLEGDYVTNIELHHIVPGAGRTDKTWNMVSLCNYHHQECTEHVKGVDAKEKNIVLALYKFVKGEMSTKKLKEFDIDEEIMALVPEIKKKYDKYRKGLA